MNGTINESKSESRAERTYTSSVEEQPRIGAIKKSDFKWLAVIVPIVIAVIYMIVCYIWLPSLYGKSLSITDWNIINPEELIAKLQDQNEVFVPTYKIWAFRIIIWLLWIGLIGSLFNLGRIFQNKKPEYNMNGLMRDREPYYKAVEINESIKTIKDNKVQEAKTSVRNVMEHLRNESAFGFGNASVINCENDIVRCLQEIEQSVSALYNEKSMTDASKIIVADCKTIMAKLKVRMEMKKR